MYYLKENTKEGFHAGGKARLDCESILNDLGIPINIPRSENDDKILPALKNILKLYYMIDKKVGNDILIVQYPYYNYLNRFKPNKKMKIVAIIHDLDGLRYDDPKFTKRDISFLKKCYRIIAHNEEMRKWLFDKGICKDRIQCIEAFDYLINESIEYSGPKEAFICYAGNLKKSEFIYKLNDEITSVGVNLFGIGFNSEFKAKGLEYEGAFPSDEIHLRLNGKFGLVWDGKEIDTCGGKLGNYMRYNNPHKMSLYLAAGLPIITWKGAAIAEFVEKNNVGYTVNSLKEVVELYNYYSDDKYNELIQNVKVIKKDIVNGNMLKRLIENIIKEEENEV